MTLFDDWPEPEQEPFTCSLCGHTKYKSVSTETNKEQYKINRKASGLTVISKIKRVDIQVTKDFAECLSCRNRTLLSESEEVIPKETKKQIADKLAETKFKGHFLDSGGEK